jgi:hypothetical protein
MGRPRFSISTPSVLDVLRVMNESTDYLWRPFELQRATSRTKPTVQRVLDAATVAKILRMKVMRDPDSNSNQPRRCYYEWTPLGLAWYRLEPPPT